MLEHKVLRIYCFSFNKERRRLCNPKNPLSTEYGLLYTLNKSLSWISSSDISVEYILGEFLQSGKNGCDFMVTSKIRNVSGFDRLPGFGL